MTKGLVSVGVVLFSIFAACAPPAQDHFTFQRPAPGKADDLTGLLPNDQVALVDSRFQEAIAAADAQISALQIQITKAEADLAAKQATIASLISQIESRRNTVQNNYNNSFNLGLFGALFGFPIVSAVSLSQAFEQDSLLQTLNAQLASARTERDNVAATIAKYQQQKAAIGAQLQPIKDNYVALKSLLAATGGATYTRPNAVDAAMWTKTSKERGRIALLSDIVANAKTQIDALKKLLALVGAANLAVDRAVATVEALAEAAAEAEAESNALFQSLLEIALSGDPNAAAESWLNETLAAKTRAALTSLGWPVEVFVDGLLDGVTDASLATRLIAAITTANPTTATPSITLDAQRVASGGFDFAWSNAPGGEYDWIGVFPEDADLAVDVELWWDFVYGATNGSQHFAETLPAGRYYVYYFVDGTYDWVARAAFEVN